MNSWILTVWRSSSSGTFGLRYSKERTEYFASKEEVSQFIEDRYLAAKCTWDEDERRCSVVVKG